MATGRHSNKQVRERAVEAWQSGMSMHSVAASFGTSRKTIQRWVARFKADEVNGLSRKKSPGSGRPLLLKQIEDDRFLILALNGAKIFGYESDLWTSHRLARAVEDAFGLRISQPTMWRHLRRLGLTYKCAERQFHEADEQKRKKWRQYEWPKIKRCVASNKAILYFQDEAHVSLSTSLGKMWSPRGVTPTIKSSGARRGFSALSSISNGGKNLLFKVVDTRVNSDVVINFLAEMLNHHKRRHLVVVMDNARPHKSKKTMDFVASQPRLHLFFLPPYSPDYNPDEKVWNYLKNNKIRDFGPEDRHELRQCTRQALEAIGKKPKLLKGIFFRSSGTNFLN